MKEKKELTVKEMASMGGKASWANLTPEERSKRASNAGKKGGWPKGKPRKVKEMREQLKTLTKKLTNNYE